MNRNDILNSIIVLMNDRKKNQIFKLYFIDINVYQHFLYVNQSPVFIVDDP